MQTPLDQHIACALSALSADLCVRARANIGFIYAWLIFTHKDIQLSAYLSLMVLSLCKHEGCMLIHSWAMLSRSNTCFSPILIASRMFFYVFWCV